MSSDTSPPPPPTTDSTSPPPPTTDSPTPPPPTTEKTPPPPPTTEKTPPPPPSTSEKTPPPPPTTEKTPPPPPPSSSSSSPSSDKKAPPPPRPPPSNYKDDKSQSSGSRHAPPPPPSKALAPPHAKSILNKVSPEEQKVIIAGVAAAAGIILLLIILCLVSCCKSRKRKQKERKYYRDNFTPNKGNVNYNNQGAWQNTVQSNEHAMRMPPSNQVSSEYGWPIQPPPPPMASSGEYGFTNFSGQHHSMPSPRPSITLGSNQSSFSYEDLAAATGGFAQTNLLGQGGFGYVHKGVLPNGKEVAVKSLKANSGQGEREFQAEVDIISRVHHRHLVSLVGYCITGSQRMLVYDFVSNNTLEYHLHGTGRPAMDWPTRLKIALGSAKGFAYLHEDCHPRIIHRDIKVANILLDDNFDAQVADFGLAKLSNDTSTHVSTRIMGTFGYLAPEYAASGKLSEKSDVYSFGVVLLELITGKRPIDMDSEDEDTLVDWARPLLSSIINDGGSCEEIVDPRLEGNYDPREVLAMLACADACTRPSGRRRPKMSQVVRALEGDVSIDALNEGIRNANSSEYGSQSDLRRIAKSAGLTSQDFTSSEKATNEFSHSSGGESQEMRTNMRRFS